MASNEQRDLEAVAQLVRATTENILKLEKASKGIAKNFAELAYQVKGQQRSMTEYLLSGIKLPDAIQRVSRALVAPADEMNAAVATHIDRLKSVQSNLEKEQAFYDGIADKRRRAAKEQKMIVESAQREVDYAKATLKLEESTLRLHKELHRLKVGELGVELLILKGFKDAIIRSGELNQSLIEANSATANRAKLSRDVWEVMAKTGNEQKDMLAAAKALTGVGGDLRGSFKDALEVMVQMEEGLGVSYENSAQLARIFEINLKTPVREVADKIAAIANQTSLAADEATRFATEIGKALRLLGPGAIQGSSAQVVGYMTAMAARMKDVGGDASEVVKAFQTLTKGTAEGFMLRGMAGVNRPGAMGTEAGSKAAMAGIDRMINQIVRSKPGMMAYTAEVEIASQVLGISTESVVLWSKMMQEANKPLTENQKLQERWRDQIANANKALNRIKESTMALIQRGFNPLIEYAITPLFNVIAKLISHIANNKVAVFVVTTALMVGLVKAAIAAGRLVAVLTQLTVASISAAIAERRRMLLMSQSQGEFGFVKDLLKGGKGGGASTALGIADIGKQLRAAFPTFIKIGSSTAGWLGKITTTYLPTFAGGIGKLGSMLGGLGGSFGRFTMSLGRLLLSPQGLLIAGAAAAGWAVGRYIDKKWPDNWIAQAARATGEWYAKVFDKANVKTAQINKFQGDKTWNQLASEMRQMVYEGKEKDVAAYFTSQAYRVKGFESERGGRSMLEMYKTTMAEARERVGLASVTSAAQATKERDQSIIKLTKDGIENTGGAKKLLERAEADRRKALAEEAARRDLEAKQRQTSQRIAPDPHGRAKYSIPVPSGQQMMY